jgi:hypothetical protein
MKHDNLIYRGNKDNSKSFFCLTSRQRLFAEILVSEGWYKAKEATQYSRVTIWRLFKNPKLKEYIMSLVKNAIKSLNLNYADLLQKRLELADNPKTPARIRDLIYKDLMEMIEMAENDESTNPAKSFPYMSNMMILKPSKEIDYKE